MEIPSIFGLHPPPPPPTSLPPLSPNPMNPVKNHHCRGAAKVLHSAGEIGIQASVRYFIFGKPKKFPDFLFSRAKNFFMC